MNLNFLNNKTSNPGNTGFTSALNLGGSQSTTNLSSNLGTSTGLGGIGGSTQNIGTGGLNFGIGNTNTNTANTSNIFAPKNLTFGGIGNTSTSTSTTPTFGNSQFKTPNSMLNTTTSTNQPTNLFSGQNISKPLTGIGFGSNTNTQNNAMNQTGMLQNNPNFQQQQNASNSLFGGQNQQSNFNLNPNVNLPQYAQNVQFLTLSPTNFLKYEKINALQPEEIKSWVAKIELSLKNNEIYLDYSETLLKALHDNFKLISTEGVKVVKYCKLINAKNTKIKFILDNLKNEINQQNDFLEKERKNYNIIEHHPTMKITIPSEYFLDIAKEMEDKILLHIQQISDLEALINLYYRKEYGTFKINSDIVETLIKELYNCLIVLVSEAARINEYVNSIKSNYVEMMKNNYNWKEYEIDNRFKTYLANSDNENKNYQIN